MIAVHVDQERAEGVLGASDAAAALGLDEHRPPIAVWRRLRGLPALEAKRDDNEPALWGQVLEPVVRGHYALRTHSAVYVPRQSYVRDGWLRATPDGLVCELQDHVEGYVAPLVDPDPLHPPEGIVQIKTCSAYLADDWASGPPAKHEVQVRVEMAVCDLAWADVACLVGGQRYVCYRVHRDAGLEANILRDLERFAATVAAGTEPPIDGSVEWQRHLSERMRPSRVAIEARGPIADAVDSWRALRATKAKLEVQEDEIKNRLLAALADAGATKLLHPSGDVTAFQRAGSPRWKEYAAALGGTEEGADKFRGEPSAWAIRAPQKWSREP